KLYEILILDRVKFENTFGHAALPEIMQDENMAEVVLLRESLESLISYYDIQYSQQVANMEKLNDKKVEVEKKPELSEADRQRIRQQVANVAQMSKSSKAVGATIASDESEIKTTPMNNQATESTMETPKTGLPQVEEIKDKGEKKIPSLPIPENSLNRLLGENSPLLQIFAPAPWLPEGKGVVTVGSEGFKWYKDTNPMERSELDRARLPTGFYGGEHKPEFVVLRMESIIL